MSISRTNLRVRYAETDQMGVVYHANFFVWFEVARAQLLRELGFDYKQMEVRDDCHIAVVEASCRYLSPARYDDELTVETSVTAVRRSVVKFAYRLLRSPEASAPESAPRLLAEAETTHVIVNRQMRAVPLPAEYSALLQAFMNSGNQATAEQPGEGRSL